MRTRFFLTTIVVLALALTPGAWAAKHHRHPPKPPEMHGAVVAPESAKAGSLRASWVQYGPGGTLEARAVVEGSMCPLISFDLSQSLMQQRAASDGRFLTICKADIPAGTKLAALAFWKSATPLAAGAASPAAPAAVAYDVIPLPLPAPDPQRIAVIGDTGCRIKGATVQDCNDPEKWPFAKIAAEAAKLRPDLVIHVGDYFYRESACPAGNAGCAGTPWGDNWPTWDADFFAPAKPLLAAAPWVIVRGNHEDCVRAGPGWLRLLGPAPYDPGAPCAGHLPPYSVPLGRLNLVVMDNADAPEESVVAGEVPVYRGEFAALEKAPSPSWLLLHRPVWGAISGPLNLPVGGNLTLMAAAEGIPAPVELMLAGHIHSFEVLNYRESDRVPPQVVAGFSGDLLDVTPANLKGTVFQGESGVRVADGLSLGGFGFLLLTRTDDGWRIDVHDPHGRIERVCVFRAGHVGCPPRR